jgi:hypothetical protein
MPLYVSACFVLPYGGLELCFEEAERGREDGKEYEISMSMRLNYMWCLEW